MPLEIKATRPIPIVQLVTRLIQFESSNCHLKLIARRSISRFQMPLPHLVKVVACYNPHIVLSDKQLASSKLSFWLMLSFKVLLLTCHKGISPMPRWAKSQVRRSGLIVGSRLKKLLLLDHLNHNLPIPHFPSDQLFLAHPVLSSTS